MNFMEYVCRGIVRSEDAICRLNKRVVKLAKCTRSLNTSILCIGIGTLMLGTVVAIQDKEIRELQKQVAELTAKPEIQNENATEEQNQQEGA